MSRGHAGSASVEWTGVVVAAAILVLALTVAAPSWGAGLGATVQRVVCGLAGEGDCGEDAPASAGVPGAAADAAPREARPGLPAGAAPGTAAPGAGGGLTAVLEGSGGGWELVTETNRGRDERCRSAVAGDLAETCIGADRRLRLCPDTRLPGADTTCTLRNARATLTECVDAPNVRRIAAAEELCALTTTDGTTHVVRCPKDPQRLATQGCALTTGESFDSLDPRQARSCTATGGARPAGDAVEHDFVCLSWGANAYHCVGTAPPGRGAPARPASCTSRTLPPGAVRCRDSVREHRQLCTTRDGTRLDCVKFDGDANIAGLPAHCSLPPVACPTPASRFVASPGRTGRGLTGLGDPDEATMPEDPFGAERTQALIDYLLDHPEGVQELTDCDPSFASQLEAEDAATAAALDGQPGTTGTFSAADNAIIHQFQTGDVVVVLGPDGQALAVQVNGQGGSQPGLAGSNAAALAQEAANHQALLAEAGINAPTIVVDAQDPNAPPQLAQPAGASTNAAVAPVLTVGADHVATVGEALDLWATHPELGQAGFLEFASHGVAVAEGLPSDTDSDGPGLGRPGRLPVRPGVAGLLDQAVGATAGSWETPGDSNFLPPAQHRAVLGRLAPSAGRIGELLAAGTPEAGDELLDLLTDALWDSGVRPVRAKGRLNFDAAEGEDRVERPPVTKLDVKARLDTLLEQWQRDLKRKGEPVCKVTDLPRAPKRDREDDGDLGPAGKQICLGGDFPAASYVTP